LKSTQRWTEEMIRSVVLCIFASYLPSILLLLGLLLPMMAKSYRLVVFLLLLLRREKGCLSIWNAKKQHPTPDVRLAKIYATHVPKKKCALCMHPRSAAAVFPYRFFILSFFSSRSLVLCILYYHTTITLFMWWCSRAFVTLVVALFYMMILLLYLENKRKDKYN